MNKIMLEDYGYNDKLKKEFKKYKDVSGQYPARVIGLTGNIYTILTEAGSISGLVRGKFRHKVKQSSDYPAVGDFVIARNIEQDKAEILHVLKRRNTFSRKMPISGGRKIRGGLIVGGSTQAQVIASNLDYIMILSGLDSNFNISRIERFLILAKKSKVKTIIVLTKKDLCTNYQHYVDIAKEADKEIEVIAVSSVTREGLDSINPYLKKGKTIALLGSSGVGKSTLLNALFNENMQKTNQVSEASGKGKHTTTNRQIFIHPSGGMIIDTPGIKEVQLWADVEDLNLIFSDIIELERECKFSNCTHGSEEGCAIIEAIKTGKITQQRYNRYKKMLRELKILSQRKKDYNRRQKNKA
ncbi:ribosome small subunit-dependent GTPase A [Clostridiaceae bacterium M8S5]|nr:ribosome small subunit-dependent GTPase A [Clostridiaceae bacterium M8S5]